MPDVAYYLVRHAAPVLGWPTPYNVMSGPPLSELGRRQAAELAGFLAAQGVTAVYTSPFARARETAEVAAARARCVLVAWPDLREGGPGEDKDALRARVLRGWQTIQEAEHPGSVAVITHGTPVRIILQALNDGTASLDRYMFDYGNPVPPAGVWGAQRQGERWLLNLVFLPTETLRESEITRDGRAFGAAIS